MEIVHQIQLDLQQAGQRQTMYAKQGDSLTRAICFALYDGGTEFTVPIGATLQIAFAKQDGKGGLYDTMPDGTAACSASGNTVTAKLHPQMFTVAGLVACELRLLTGTGEQLSTFSWYIAVQASATADITSEGYYRFATLDGVIANVGDLSKLATTAKSNLVAAINEVFGKVPTDFVKTVNQLRPSARGDVQLFAKDIYATVQALQYQGNIEGALEALAALVAQPALPIAKAYSQDKIAYTAEVVGFPAFGLGNGSEQIVPMGKGLQIVYIPYVTNSTTAPTLEINKSGLVIPIRLRAPRNQVADEQAPDATLPVPAGALMRGVPYTMTFCGKYWLVDSQIAQFDPHQADMMRRFADKAIGLSEGDTIGMPVINSMDGIAEEVAFGFIRRSQAEYASPPEDGSVLLPTEGRVDEMIRKDVTEQYAAWTPSEPKRAAEGPSDDPLVGEKTVEAFAKTLGDGRYSLTDEYDSLWIIDTLTANGIQWRILREYTDEFCYYSAYCSETLAYSAESETGRVFAGGRKLLNDDDIPLPSAADAGKILTVSAAGRAQWTAVVNAEEVAV